MAEVTFSDMFRAVRNQQSTPDLIALGMRPRGYTKFRNINLVSKLRVHGTVHFRQVRITLLRHASMREELFWLPPDRRDMILSPGPTSEPIPKRFLLQIA
jgi:hypothetical protein